MAHKSRRPLLVSGLALWLALGCGLPSSGAPVTLAPTKTSVPTMSPTPMITSEPTPTPETAVETSLWCDMNSFLTGPAGDPASRNPETVFMGEFWASGATQVMVESPNGERVVFPLDLERANFWGSIQGLPQAGGTYTCTALNADGAPIPGAVTSDVYVGGYELDPPANVQAEVVEAGLLVTWDPLPVIPGAFDPNGSPSIGHYHIPLYGEGEVVYGWVGPEISHLIPFHHRDFAPGDTGLALEELEDGAYHLSVHAASQAPEGTAGRNLESQAFNPEEDVQIVIERGGVQIETP